jgi:CoA:oxalate CoA-transferase
VTARKPLRGLRVLDLSRVISGPICGRILADMGAEVIKVESPEGDLMREMLPATDGLAHIYAHMNAGKREICIDLKNEAGRALVADLAERSDVLLENFRPGVADRLGIGAASMLERNPRLIYCSISGWGQDGPWAKRAAYAPMVHAEMGTLALAAELRGESVRQEVHHHADLYAGLVASNAILGAVIERSITDRGQHIDVSMAEVMLYVNEYSSAAYSEDSQTVDSFTFQIFPLADGTLVNLVGNPVRMFSQWVAALEASDSAEDPRFNTPAAVEANLEAALIRLREILGRVPDSRSLDQAFAPQGLLFAVVRSLEAALDTEWARSREVMAETAPGILIPRAAWRSSTLPRDTPSPPGPLGKDNEAVLRDVLDLDEQAIRSLARQGALQTATPLDRDRT